MESAKLGLRQVLGALSCFGASKIFIGQVHYGHLLVTRHVDNFSIFTP